MKKFLIFIAFVFFSNSYGQEDDIWQKIKPSQARISKRENPSALPKKYDLYKLNIEVLKSKLEKARNSNVNPKPVLISFPNASGQLENYAVYENSIMAAELELKYSSIKNYIGVNTQNPSETIQFTTTIFGLHALEFSQEKGDSYIEPLLKDATEYLVYSSRDINSVKDLHCQVKNNAPQNRQSNKSSVARAAGDGNFRKFRLALSSTLGYSNFHIARASLINGTTTQKRAAVLAAMVVTIARVNSIFERDLGVKLELVPNNDLLISIDRDNFTATEGSLLLNENQEVVDSKIGNSNYDIGHVFSNGDTGIAEEGCVCSSSSKARGVTGTDSPVGDPFDVDYVAHEMGHQFGASHTFNGSIGPNSGNTGNCDTQNLSESTAVEPGSGSTIMGYAGICNSIDIQKNSDPYFSFISIDQITNYLINDAGCSVNVRNTNARPSITGLQSYTIPKSTPFVLNASVSNTNTASYTYCWEQNDIEASVQPPNATSQLGPLFRSIVPTQNSFRYFPALSTVISNSTQNKWEVVPSVARTMNFVVTVRDNGVVNGGLTSNAGLQVTVANVGPFLITAPNTNVSWEYGTNQTVTWDVAGTNANGINTTNVDIYLSTDGGLTFPVELAMNVPNDGSEEISVPDNVGTQNRIMIKGHGSIFYDVSNANFEIAETTTPSFRLKADIQTISQCDGTGAKNATYRILYSTIAGFSGTTLLSATGNPSGSTINFSKNNLSQNEYVDLTIGNLTNAPTGTYNIVVTGVSGAITRRMNLYLEIYSSVFPKVKLIAPANFRETPPNDLTLTWESTAGIPLYDIQIATDTDFTTIIESATVQNNSYIATKLENGVVYFWRVKPKNKGCSGEFSDVFQFKTVFCNSFGSENNFVSNQIPYNKTENAFSEILIEKGNGIIIDNLNVYVDITYPDIEFLKVKIVSPIGTEVVLFEDQCEDQGENISATFSDDGVPIVCGLNPSIGGFVMPKESLSKLYGESSKGTWKLEVDYNNRRASGEIQNWVLNLCSNQKEVGGDNEINQMALYPNPSSGSFNVEMDNVRSKEVTVYVVDAYGRRVYAFKYKTKGTYFNKNIELSLSAGVYFVTTVDGGRELTKKLVVTN
jgi:subtilisin-like proprotein convertase family protein